MLADGSQSIKLASGSSRDMCLRLINLGRGAGGGFLAAPDSHPPYLFGLAQMAEFVQLLSSLVHRVTLLMKLATEYFPKATEQDMIIQYRLQDDNDLKSGVQSYGYITIIPSSMGIIHNWTSEQSTAFELTKHPWFPKVAEWSVQWHPLPSDIKIFKLFSKRWTYSGRNPFFDDAPDSVNSGDSTDVPDKGGPIGKPVDTSQDHQRDDDDADTLMGGLFEDEELENAIPEVKIEITVATDDAPTTSQGGSGVGQLQPEPNPTSGNYTLYIGNIQYCALFVRDTLFVNPPSMCIVVPEQVEQAMTNQWINSTTLRRSIEAVTYWAATIGFRDYASSLLALGIIEKVYSAFGDATITPSIVKAPLHSAKWLGIGDTHTYKELNNHPNLEMQREEAFSCISYLETGLDLAPEVFKKVVAVSVGDSIFVAGGLLCDPVDLQKKSLIKRLIGNFGKPGIALLIPPPNPLCRQSMPEDWKLINHDLYQGGTVDDAFSGTTLHLSFTGWSMQVDTSRNKNDRGVVDKEVEMYEALVSVHESGKWIADLDVLTAISKSSFDQHHDFFYKVRCTHEQTSMNTGLACSEMSFDDCPVITIGSWEELLDFLNRPKGPALALTHGNWTARLAITSLAVLRCIRVFTNDGFCRDCYIELRDSWPSELFERTLFIC